MIVDLDDDDENLSFSQELRNVPVSSHYVMSKIPKYDRRGNPTKHLNGYKTHTSLWSTTLAVKCRAFHLTLRETTKNWYNRLPPRSIRSRSEFKTTFLKRFAISKKRLQHFQDMRSQPGKSLKSFFLFQVTNEMACRVQVTDCEALLTLHGYLNIGATKLM